MSTFQMLTKGLLSCYHQLPWIFGWTEELVGLECWTMLGLEYWNRILEWSGALEWTWNCLRMSLVGVVVCHDTIASRRNGWEWSWPPTLYCSSVGVATPTKLVFNPAPQSDICSAVLLEDWSTPWFHAQGHIGTLSKELSPLAMWCCENLPGIDCPQMKGFRPTPVHHSIPVFHSSASVQHSILIVYVTKNVWKVRVVLSLLVLLSPVAMVFVPRHVHGQSHWMAMLCLPITGTYTISCTSITASSLLNVVIYIYQVNFTVCVSFCPSGLWVRLESSHWGIEREWGLIKSLQMAIRAERSASTCCGY